MYGDGDKVIANRLLFVFYSLMLVSNPGLSWSNSKDSSRNLEPNIEQFPSIMVPSYR